MSLVILKGKNNTFGTYQNGKLVATHQGVDTYKQDVLPQAEMRNDGDFTEMESNISRVEYFKETLEEDKPKTPEVKVKSLKKASK